jgi:hypothetical protein
MNIDFNCFKIFIQMTIPLIKKVMICQDKKKIYINKEKNNFD